MRSLKPSVRHNIMLSQTVDVKDIRDTEFEQYTHRLNNIKKEIELS